MKVTSKKCPRTNSNTRHYKTVDVMMLMQQNHTQHYIDHATQHSTVARCLVHNFPTTSIGSTFSSHVIHRMGPHQRIAGLQRPDRTHNQTNFTVPTVKMYRTTPLLLHVCYNGSQPQQLQTPTNALQITMVHEPALDFFSCQHYTPGQNATPTDHHAQNVAQQHPRGWRLCCCATPTVCKIVQHTAGIVGSMKLKFEIVGVAVGKDNVLFLTRCNCACLLLLPWQKNGGGRAGFAFQTRKPHHRSFAVVFTGTPLDWHWMCRLRVCCNPHFLHYIV